MNPVPDLKKIFLTTAIASGAMLASLCVYVLTVEIAKSQLRPFRGLFVSGVRPQTLRYLFFGAAILAVVLVRIAGRARFKHIPGESFAHLTSRLSRTTVTAAALAELPAVLGFVLFLLTGLSRDFYFLLFCSLVLEFMYFPRFRDWQEVVRESFPQQAV
jgi:hypothetical protein